MAINLTSTQQIIHHVNLLVYGESGAGKTTICGTAPDPLIVSAEGGLLSLADKDIPVFEIQKRADCDEIYDWLKMSKEAHKYKTICFDSLSEIAEVLLADEKAANKDARAAYGIMAEEMSILIRGFRDLDFNTVFTAKAKKVVDEATGAITFMPSVPGQQLLNNLPYFFDEVLRLDIGKDANGTFRYLQTVGDRRFVAKDRSGKLLPQEKPDIAYIFNKIVSTGVPMTAAKKSDAVKTQPKVNT